MKEVASIENILNQIQMFSISDNASLTNHDVAIRLHNHGVTARKHGRWIRLGNNSYRCSECHADIQTALPYPNCPYCLASMSGEQQQTIETTYDPISRGKDAWVVTLCPLTTRRGTIVAADRAKNKIVVILYDSSFPVSFAYEEIGCRLFIGPNARLDAEMAVAKFQKASQYHIS